MTVARRIPVIVSNGTGWMDDAACRGMDTNLFFPETETFESTKVAKDTCRTCPVREQCLDYVLQAEPAQLTQRNGIWAGTTKKERQRLRRERVQLAKKEARRASHQ